MLSVIIVNFNTKELLRACLRSLRTAEPRAEVIVVDNGSKDGSAAMVRKQFPGVKLIANRKNRGFAAANNQGFMEATGDYVVMLNSDTELPKKGALSELAKYLERRPKVGVVAPRLSSASGEIQQSASWGCPSWFTQLLEYTLLNRVLYRLFPRRRYPGKLLLSPDELKKTQSVGDLLGACLVFNRSLLREAGLLDERFFVFLEETDFNWRVKKLGYELHYYPRVTVIHHWGGTVDSSGSLDWRFDLYFPSLYEFFRKQRGRRGWLPARIVGTLVPPVTLVLACVFAALEWIPRRTFGSRGKVAQQIPILWGAVRWHFARHPAKPKPVAIVAQHVGLPVGIGSYAAGLIPAIAKRKPNADFIVCMPSRTWVVEKPENVSLRLFDVPLRRSRLAWWEMVTVPLWAHRERVRLLHYLNAAAPLVAWPRKVVITAHDAINELIGGYRLPAIYRFCWRRSVRRADRVIMVSEAAKRDLVQCTGIPAGKVTVAANGAPPVDSKDVRKQPYLLFVGGLEKRKNLPAAVAALQQAGITKLRLVVVGPTNGSPIHYTKAEVFRHISPQVRKRVEFRGFVSENELADLYRKATGLVFPSYYEGFGLPLLEAMSRRTPVVASNTSAIPEVTHGAAVLTDPHDSQGLADGIRLVVNDAPARKRMVRRGVRVAKQYSWDRSAAAVMRGYGSS